MVRRHGKLAVCTFMLGILIAIGAIVASAADAYSSWGYYGPILGYSYKNQAEVTSNYLGTLGAITYVDTQDYSNVPTGYMGVKAQLYNSSDNLVAFSDWSYNNSEAWGWNQGAACSSCGSGIYYSKGVTAAYNGNGYNTYYTFQSPNINY